MTDEEIHNIYLHMSGKAEGLVEATGTADFPVLFARAILEYEGLTKDAQNMASKSTYKEQLETKDEPVSDKLERLLWEFIDLKAMHPNHNPDPRTWPHVFAYAPKPNHLVAWGMEKDGVILDVICPEEHEREEGEYTTPLYTTPQRTWVGLTDEDMNNALDYWSDNSRSAYGGAHAANGEYVDMIETWRYIETKLKERNT